MADTEARWYCVNAQGLPMLCASKEDAEREATRNDKVWPKGAPHRAAKLCDAAERDRLNRLLDEAVKRNDQMTDWYTAAQQKAVDAKADCDALRADVRELVECLSTLCTHKYRSCRQIDADWDAARALLAKHALQALADNAREMGLSYEGESNGK